MKAFGLLGAAILMAATIYTPSALGASRSAAESGRRLPNIVFILADDIGYECLGAYGSTSYKTPNLDRLAATGVRFDRAYMQPSCSPTRVQLMTGLSNRRNYLFWARIDPGSTTFATLLKKAGYATCMAGKWQLGPELDLPKKVGFDEYCLWQHLRIPPRYANPGLEINGVPKDYNHGEYGPDLISDYILDYVERKKAEPFFLYYSMMLVHGPNQPTPDSQDYDPKAIGERVNQSAAHFVDMVAYLDKLTGKLLAKLDALGLRENTLIIFAGDNGTAKGTRSMLGDKLVIGGKGLSTDAGMHVPLIANWPGQVPAGGVCADLVDSTDYLPTLLAAAGVDVSKELKLDGRSFYPQIRGQHGNPREWIYSWYSTRKINTDDKELKECAFNHDFKLYPSGDFYDLRRDIEEKHPLKVSALDKESASAAKLLQGALDHFKDIRPTKPVIPKGTKPGPD